MPVIGPELVARWERLVGREKLIEDPRFADDLLRADHRDIITEAMNAWLATRTTEDAMREMEAARVPAGHVLNLAEVLKNPQVTAREVLKYVDYPDASKPVPLADTAVRLSATPGGIRQRAPMLGEHTDEVLREIGYSDEEIGRLRAELVV